MSQPPCPYCGTPRESPDASRCGACGGLFEPLSRKATQLAMGPWFVRDEARPFMPGFSEAILRQQVRSGRVQADTIVRGPTTNQFWMRAGEVPGLSRLLGRCHACGGAVSAEDPSCGACSADLSLPTGVDRLGLSYIDPASRQQAQAEVDAMRTGSPAPPPRRPAAQQSDPGHIDPNLLEPVAAAPQQPDHDHPPAVEPIDEYDGPQAADIVEDLWHSDAPPTTTRRRRRSGGPDPMVLGLGVLLVCVVGIGLFLLVTGGLGGDADENAASASNNAPPQRTAKQAASLGSEMRSMHDRLVNGGVPKPFEQTLEEAKAFIRTGDRALREQDYDLAYDQFDRAKALLVPVPAEIAKWEADQEAREEVTDLRTQVQMLRDRSEQLEAEQWSPAAFSAGQAVLGRAEASIEAGKYTEAIDSLSEARDSFQEALNASQLASGAVEARTALFEQMKAGPSEQTLRNHTPQLLDRLIKLREAAARHMSSRAYAEAEDAYRDASRALAEAEEKLELLRYRKVYAYHAGYGAANLLLGIASGDTVDGPALEALALYFERLMLDDNPAAGLKAGESADYTQAADRLVNGARTALIAKHGEPVQASYKAGFQASIIEQTLATQSLTEAQQKRIHQSLDAFQKQAAAGGWDLSALKPVIESVRAANRNARRGSAPTNTREAFDVLMRPFVDRESASRLMDPILSPGKPDDPELFPNLGSTRF